MTAVCLCAFACVSVQYVCGVGAMLFLCVIVCVGGGGFAVRLFVCKSC